MNHPNLLAFEVMIQPDEPYEDLDASWRTITATGLADLSHIVSKERHWCVLAVHHISEEDNFTITDVVWDASTDLLPYSDTIAEESFARQS